MKTINKIAKIREKLDLYGKRYIEKEFLQKLLNKFAPNYTITNLVSKELIVSIKRGKVYVNTFSKEISYPFVVADLYMGDELYVIGGLGVYNYYGFSEQIASKYTIYNTKSSGEKIIGDISFIFVKQRESFFYGIKKVVFEGNKYYIMSPERALIQMIKEGKTFKELPYGVDKEKLLKMAKKYSSKNIISQIEKLCI